MRILKCAMAFVLAFCMLAVTVVCSAVATPDMIALTKSSDVDENIEPYTELEITEQGDSTYAARMHAPKLDNPYYYSNKNVFYKYGYGMPNCTCYAWGRAYEILKTEPKLCIYDAHLWYDYNKKNGYYKYGQTPKLGAIACYKYKNYDSGHVAVVEKIIGDTVYYSNSAWSGQTFYINTSPVDDPEQALPTADFLGFIYIGEFDSPTVDYDEYRITSDNGVNMRSGAGTSYQVVSAIPYNVVVQVTKTTNAGGYTWGYTIYNGVAGWFVTDFAQKISGDDTKPKPEPEPILGDVNLDSKLSVLDATVIQRYLAYIDELTDEQKALADFDKNSVISILDATKIRFALLKLEE